MKRIIVALLAVLAFAVEGWACTSAIVTAQRSSEGAPLLWKHRDSNPGISRVEYITGGKYAYTAIVPNDEHYAEAVYAGVNEKGLGIMNTATQKLPEATPEEYATSPLEETALIFSAIMQYALSNCATVEEFENFLRRTKRVRGFNTNLGVADANGGVVYFEVWDLGYCRYDVAERKEGFDIRSNFSFKGDPNFGTSKRRYDLIMGEMNAHKGKITPQLFMEYSRSYKSLAFGDVLATDEAFICENHTVPRSTTVSSVVLVCDAKNPRMLVMNGHTVSSLAVPVYVNAKEAIPQCVKGTAMQRLSEDFCAKAYNNLEYEGSVLNKEVVRDVLKIKHPKIAMPKRVPTNIKAFNTRLDKLFANHEQRVRKVLAKH